MRGSGVMAKGRSSDTGTGRTPRHRSGCPQRPTRGGGCNTRGTDKNARRVQRAQGGLEVECYRGERGCVWKRQATMGEAHTGGLEPGRHSGDEPRWGKGVVARERL